MERICSAENFGVDGWDQFYQKKGDSWRDKDYHKLYHLFTLEKMKGTIADIGCGLGDGLLFLKRKIPYATKLYGFDFAEETIARNKERFELNEFDFQPKDICKPLCKKFDNIICLQTIEHLPDPEKAVHNMIESATSTLIVGAPYKNRRPDKDHLWSFDENDFKSEFDFIQIDDNQKNIYWVRGASNLKRGLLSKIFVKKFLR